MKKRTLLLVLVLVALLITTSGSPYVEARASTAGTSVLSGGRYILTINSPAGQQPTGYQWMRAGTEASPGEGCCCKSYMPCTRK
jgi:hypothetical protein